jgi:hypothetical protein
MPLGAIIAAVVPFVFLLLVLYLRYLYGDAPFESDAFTRELNDEKDTRLLKLNLRTPPAPRPGDSSSRPSARPK